jgi:glycosyltransferase involved in cell wall biosynthesis
LITSTPYVKRTVSSTFGRRTLTPGLSNDKVLDAGVVYDLAAALSLRSGVIHSGPMSYRGLMARRNAAIARKANKLLSSFDFVIGNYGVAEGTFKRVKARGGRTVLNYPNAHHHFSRKMLDQEANLEPAFASTISDNVVRLADTYDAECQLADMILVGSSFVRNTFIDEGLGAKRIEVIPYGCDTTRFYPTERVPTLNSFKALFVGQLTQRKGLSYLLRGYQMFHGPGTELLIVGRHVGSVDVLNPFRGMISYMGNQPNSSLGAIYRQADVFVFPTLIEGMPLAVLEAMASGLPVITTAQGPGDIVRDGIEGFIVPIRDPAAIAERLSFLRANPDVRAEMGRAARSRALEFTWEAYCQTAVRTVLSLAEGQPDSNLNALTYSLNQ